MDCYGLDASNIESIKENRNYNKKMAEYYYLAQSENSVYFNRDKLVNRRERLLNCNRIWCLDFYKKQKIKEIKKIYLCKDKFCSNCKKVKQASRMATYIPVLEEYSDCLFHFVLTVPNVDGNILRLQLKHMSKCFSNLIRILDGRKKIVGLNFEYLEYIGCVRSLEITFKGDSYHPHYHCAIALRGISELNKDKVNKFSYNNRKGIRELNRMFSELEILMQKIWYLLINKERLTLKNINNVDLGYSCILDKFNENDYAEIFKYMTKDLDEEGNELTYSNFLTLLYALHSTRQIQGYGKFFNIKDDTDIEKFVDDYSKFLEKLQAVEIPERIKEFLEIEEKQKITKNLKNRGLDWKSFDKTYNVVENDKFLYISFKKYMLYYRQIQKNMLK